MVINDKRNQIQKLQGKGQENGVKTSTTRKCLWLIYTQ